MLSEANQKEENMSVRSILLASAMAVGIAIPVVDAASAEGQGMMHGSMSPGMMGQMCRGMMMGSGMGSGMMGSGMMHRDRESGTGGLFGSRVTPMMNLSVEDVRGYLATQLERLKNKRLKVGDVRSEDGTITADIVTVDNSLVQRLKIDRHTGKYES
jgi:hypothetical protein